MELRIRHHPTLNCLCRSDGAVFVFGNPDNRAAHWTFGSMRADNLRFATRKEQQANLDVNYTVELKLKTRTKTEFSEWYWNTYHMFSKENTAQYQRALRFYKKHGCFPVRGG